MWPPAQRLACVTSNISYRRYQSLSSTISRHMAIGYATFKYRKLATKCEIYASKQLYIDHDYIQLLSKLAAIKPVLHSAKWFVLSMIENLRCYFDLHTPSLWFIDLCSVHWFFLLILWWSCNDFKCLLIKYSPVLLMATTCTNILLHHTSSKQNIQSFKRAAMVFMMTWFK